MTILRVPGVYQFKWSLLADEPLRLMDWINRWTYAKPTTVWCKANHFYASIINKIAHTLLAIQYFIFKLYTFYLISYSMLECFWSQRFFFFYLLLRSDWIMTAFCLEPAARGRCFPIAQATPYTPSFTPWPHVWHTLYTLLNHEGAFRQSGIETKGTSDEHNSQQVLT